MPNPPRLPAPQPYTHATGHLHTVNSVVRTVYQKGSLLISKDQLVCLAKRKRWNNAAKREYSEAWRRLYGKSGDLCIQTLPGGGQVHLTSGPPNCGEYDSTRDRMFEEIADELFRDFDN